MNQLKCIWKERTKGPEQFYKTHKILWKTPSLLIVMRFAVMVCDLWGSTEAIMTKTTKPLSPNRQWNWLIFLLNVLVAAWSCLKLFEAAELRCQTLKATGVGWCVSVCVRSLVVCVILGLCGEPGGSMSAAVKPLWLDSVDVTVGWRRHPAVSCTRPKLFFNGHRSGSD